MKFRNKVDKFSYVKLFLTKLQNWRPGVCGNADLPGRSVAITSIRPTKLEPFDEIGKRGQRNYENEFLEEFCQILQEIIIY